MSGWSFGTIVEQVALRNHGGIPASMLTADNVRYLIKSLITGENTTDFIRTLSNQMYTPMENTFRPAPVIKHSLFMSTSISTADCIAIYRMLGEPLPKEEDFPSKEYYHYAYHKD